MSTLELDLVLGLLAESKQRGNTKPVVVEFAESGELYTNLSEHPAFTGQKPTNIRQNVNTVLKGDDAPEGSFKVLMDKSDKDNHKVILINLDKVAELKGAEAASEINDQPDED